MTSRTKRLQSPRPKLSELLPSPHVSLPLPHRLSRLKCPPTPSSHLLRRVSFRLPRSRSRYVVILGRESSANWGPTCRWWTSPRPSSKQIAMSLSKSASVRSVDRIYTSTRGRSRLLTGKRALRPRLLLRRRSERRSFFFFLRRRYVMGHEICGSVISVGKDVKNFKLGDKIVSETSCHFQPRA